MTIGSRLRQLREGLQITQAELAKAAGTSQSQIDRLEKGQRKLTVEWVKRIASAMNIDWMDAIEERPSGYAVPEGVATAQLLSRPDVPLRISYAGKSDKYFLLTTESKESVRRPLGIGADEFCFATLVHSFKMADRWLPGDIIFMLPHRRPNKGEYAVVVAPTFIEPPGPTCLFGRFGGIVEGNVVLDFMAPDIGDFNPGVEIPVNKVDAIWKVADWSDLI